MSTIVPAPGDWNAVCFECGRKHPASMLKKHWKGYYVCPEHWEARHPQDFVSGVPDRMEVPWSQPPVDIIQAMCTPNGLSAVPGAAEPGCVAPGYLSPAFNTETGAL